MDSTHFNITQDERNAGTLTPEKLKRIRSSFATTGYAVVSRFIPPAICELLLQAVHEDVALVRARPEPTLHEQRTGVGHLQLGLRRCAPFVKAEIVANPLIESIVAALLGPGAWLGFYNGNVNTPGSGSQPLHYDRPYAWKSEAEATAAGQPWPPPTITVSCSVALFDITAESGATEIYPGSQRETAVADWPRGERVEYHPELIAQWGPPSRMAIPAGGICFRDPRMWHRGMPNHGDKTRPMIALTYHSGLAKHWRGLLAPNLSDEEQQRCAADPSLRVMDDGTLGDGRLVFDESARTAFESTANLHGVYRNARFVEAPLTVNHFVDAHELGGARVVKAGQVTPYPDVETK
ncbi:MAG: phytanoyl-CoA dioxygenase family protein [Caldilineaceae bacterium]|nr:phytanoyl-CoA dioxygenase family protein [Caldilineaceae bacterium]